MTALDDLRRTASNSPPHRAKGAPLAQRGEGLGMGGIPTASVLQSPPPPFPHKGGGMEEERGATLLLSIEASA